MVYTEYNRIQITWDSIQYETLHTQEITRVHGGSFVVYIYVGTSIATYFSTGSRAAKTHTRNKTVVWRSVVSGWRPRLHSRSDFGSLWRQQQRNNSDRWLLVDGEYTP